jgi:hypothetical protein
MPTLSRRNVCLGLITCLSLAYSTAELPAQIPVEEKQPLNHDIRCVIQTERGQWKRTTEAVVFGTIENETDGPLELEVDPVIYLSSRTSSEMGDKYWAPTDLLHDKPISTEKHAIGAGKEAEGIEAVPIRLLFKAKGDKIDFRVDARHLLWAKVIWSGWPSSALFGIVKSDDYDLQVVLETDNGRVESSKVHVSIDTSKPPKQ